MANVDAPRGFVPVKNGSGTAPKIETFTAKDSVAIYEGSAVIIDQSTGKVDIYTDADGFLGNVLGVSAMYLPAARTDREIQVYTDINQEYELQADGSDITTIAGWFGLLFQLVNPSGGSTTTGHSTTEIDSGTAATITGGDASGNMTPIRIERVSEQINNEPNAEFTRYVVRFIFPVMLRGGGIVGLLDAYTLHSGVSS